MKSYLIFHLPHTPNTPKDKTSITQWPIAMVLKLDRKKYKSVFGFKNKNNVVHHLLAYYFLFGL